MGNKSEGGATAVTTKERAEETLQRLKERLPDIFSMDWLDSHREDVVQILEERPPSAVSKALSININSLNSWRKRRGLSGRRGKDAAVPGPDRPADAGQTIAPDLIDDNPWQPRKTLDPEALESLAGSIGMSGLLQFPLGRRQPDGRVQLGFAKDFLLSR